MLKINFLYLEKYADCLSSPYLYGFPSNCTTALASPTLLLARQMYSPASELIIIHHS